MINKEDSKPSFGSLGEKDLQKKFHTKSKADEFYSKQMCSSLAPKMMDFISNQELVFVSSSDSKGECDCSFRSGPKGFVIVLDEDRLVYAEHKGNGVMATLGNISENPHIGLLFLDFLKDKIGLHVNGQASILEAKELESHLDVNSLKLLKEAQNNLSQKQIVWVLIKVEEAYIHCSKNIPLFNKNSNSKDMLKNRPIDYFGLQEGS